MWSGCTEKMSQAPDLALVGEILEGLKGRHAAQKVALESIGFGGQVALEGKFPCAICEKGVSSNSILNQFCNGITRCIRDSSSAGKLKEDSKFKFQSWVNQQTDIAEDYSDIEIKGQSLEIVKTFHYLGVTTGPKRGVVDTVTTGIRSGWSMFRDLVPLLAIRSLSLGPKCRLHTCVCSIILYVGEVWSVKQDDVID